jgi:hypothetical protein
VKRVLELAVARGWLLALTALALYVWLAPAHIVDGDNAEFATLATLGGVAHPSGYPLYLLWLHATAWLPAANAAHAAAIATAVLGAATVAVLHAACRSWGARPLAATIAGALFAGAPIVVAISTQAEVFALNNLLVACVLWLAAQRGPARGLARAGLLGLVAGLGLANHLTCALVAPVGVLGVARAVREARWTALAAAAGGLVLGLMPYLYLFATPDSALSWGTVRDLGDLVAMITRRDYGGAGAFLGHDHSGDPMQSLIALAATLARCWLWLPFVGGLAALAIRTARAGEGETRVAWGALAAAWLLAGPLLALRFNIAPEGLGRYVVERFYVLPALLLTVPVAVALDAVGARLPERVRAIRAMTPIAATLGFVAIAALSLPRVTSVHTAAVERYVENTLGALPPDAVVITTADDLYFGGAYVQRVLGERQDVAIISASMIKLGWYRERVGVHSPLAIQIASHVVASGRPLFVDSHQDLVLQAFPSYPHGTLMRVLARDAPQPSLDDVIALNRDLYRKFVLDYPRPGADDEWPAEEHIRYAATWWRLAAALRRAGRPEDAQAAAEAAQALAPVE